VEQGLWEINMEACYVASNQSISIADCRFSTALFHLPVVLQYKNNDYENIYASLFNVHFLRLMYLFISQE
jgi:hypothetical protein